MSDQKRKQPIELGAETLADALPKLAVWQKDADLHYQLISIS